MRTLSRSFVWVGLSGLLAALVVVTPNVFAVELAAGAPTTYTVRSGDTLWDIAGQFLRDPWRWSAVWRANPDLADPDRIYPGDTLVLTQIDGQPVITRAERRGGPRVVKLSPQVRSEAVSAPIPTIRLNVIAPFLTQPYVAESNDLKRASYVVGFPDEHLVAGLHDSIYVRKIRSEAVKHFQILRPGEPLTAFDDPDQVLGHAATFVGNAELERTGDPARLRVTQAAREVMIGDRVLPAKNEQPFVDFLPHPAPAGARGRILSVMNGVSQIGQYDVVIVDRGSRDRLEPGHVFTVFAGGQRERDEVRTGIADSDWLMDSPASTSFWYGREYRFTGWSDEPRTPDSSFAKHPEFQRSTAAYVKPFEPAGELMVFKTFERVSFALILRATRALQVGDWIAPPSI